MSSEINNKKPNIAFIAVIAISFIILVVGVMFFLMRLSNTDSNQGNSPSTQVEINTLKNHSVPEFALPSLINHKVKILSSHLPKEPYLLNIWATWCIACSREHPLLLKLQQQGVNIVGVNYKDDNKYAKEYLKTEGNPYSMVIEDEEGDLGIELGLTGAPETYVVDNKGIIRQHITGEITEEKWKNRMQPCLQLLQGNDAVTDEKLKQLCQ